MFREPERSDGQSAGGRGMLAPGGIPWWAEVWKRKRRKTKGRPPAAIVVRDWPSIAATHAVRRIASTEAPPKRRPLCSGIS